MISSDRVGDTVFASVCALQYNTHVAAKPHIREMWSTLQLGFSILPDRLRRGKIKSGWAQSGVKVLSGKLTPLWATGSRLISVGEVASCRCPEVLECLSASEIPPVVE